MKFEIDEYQNRFDFEWEVSLLTYHFVEEIEG